LSWKAGIFTESDKAICSSIQNPIFHNIISFYTKKGFGEKNYSPSTERATGERSEISTSMLRYSTTGRHL
jgi:hypothetical protein